MEFDNKNIDILKELINIGVGRGASVLNTLLNSFIELDVPEIKVVKIDDLLNEMFENEIVKLSAVDMQYNGFISGNSTLLFTTESAMQLVTALVGSDAVGDMFDDIMAGTLIEVGNIVLNGIMGSIANVLKIEFDYTVPEYLEDSSLNILKIETGNINRDVLLAKTRFTVKEYNLIGNFLLFFEAGSAEKLIGALNDVTEGYGL